MEEILQPKLFYVPNTDVLIAQPEGPGAQNYLTGFY